MHDTVDLRSDTLTLPTPAMRQAMATAAVGDDVWEVIFHVDRPLWRRRPDAGALARKVKIHQVDPASSRCVTHTDVDTEDVERALEAFREITAGW